jgi:hypothetical protein
MTSSKKAEAIKKTSVDQQKYWLSKPEVAYTKKAHEVRLHDFLIIYDRPCRVRSLKLFSPNGMLCISGIDTQLHVPMSAIVNNIPETAANREMLVGPFEDVLFPKPHGIPANVQQRHEFIQLGNYPCRLTDMSTSRAGYTEVYHVIGLDIFPGERKECLFRCQMLVPQITVNFEEAGLLDVSNDGHYSFMGKDNSVAGGLKIYREHLAKSIKES